MGKVDRANPFNQWRKEAGVSTHECYDQFGRQIGVGDFIMMQAHGQVVWRVTNSKPVMHPQAPPGLVELTAAAVTQVGLQGGAPLPGIIKVRDALEYLTPEQLEQYKAEARAGGGVQPPGTEAGGSPQSEGNVSQPPPPPEPPAPSAAPAAEPSRIILP